MEDPTCGCVAGTGVGIGVIKLIGALEAVGDAEAAVIEEYLEGPATLGVEVIVPEPPATQLPPPPPPVPPPSSSG